MQENNGQGVPFTLYAEKARLSLTGDGELLSAGMAGVVPVRFEFSGDWDGLEKTAVFTNGVRTVKVAQSQWSDGVCILPAEVLAAAGKTVMVGVYGSNGLHLVLPTVWCVLGRVEPAADLSGASLPDSAALGTLVTRIEALEADHLLIAGMVPRDQQAAKTNAMTQAVGIDGNGKLWVPPAASGVGTVAATELAGVYSYYGADFDFTTVDDVMQLAGGGMQLRLAILGTNSTYLLTHMQGSQSTARLHFTGVTWAAGMNSPTLDVFEIDAQLHVTLVSSTDLADLAHPLTVTLTESGGTVSSDTSLSDICDAVGIGREIRVCAEGRQALVGEVNLSSALFYAVDATGGVPTLTEYELTSSGVTASVKVLGDALTPCVVTVTGPTASIASAADNTVYECGEVSSLTVTAATATGEFLLIFTSGSTPTVLTLPQAIDDNMPVGFSVEANTRYEISVRKNYPLIAGWAVSA